MDAAAIVRFVLDWIADDPDVHVNGMDDKNVERLTADLSTALARS